MVALKEVSDFALAEFGITKFSGGGRTAQNKLGTLLTADLRTLVRKDQLLYAIVINA